MARRHNRGRKKARKMRKVARAAELERWTRETPGRVLARGVFVGRIGRRDGVLLTFRFSGVPVPVEDEGDPSKDLAAKAALALRDRGEA